MTMRLIATEEACSFPDVVKALNAHSKSNTDTSLDMRLVRQVYGDGGIRAGIIDRLCDIEGDRLAQMDASGIDMHVLSLTSPGVQMLDPDLAAQLATQTNDTLAEICKRRPTRFAALGSFAPQEPERAAKEIERCKAIGLNGLIVNSHTNDEYYDLPKYWPMFEAMEAAGLPLYIHPRSPSKQLGTAFAQWGMDSAIWGYGIETATNALRMIMSGLFDKFPKLKIILGHMGEAIPFWLWRIDYMHAATATTFGGAPKLQHKPSEYFRRNFAITTSGVEHHPALKYSIEVLGPENVMWAIDYPYQPMVPAVQFMRTAPIPEDVKAMVAGGNAERIFNIAPLGAGAK